MNTLPPLRTDIELVPARAGDQDLVLVRDALGIVSADAAVPAEVARYLPFFNGTATVGDLQLVMMRYRGGTLVFRSEVEALVGELDRLGVLQTEGYRVARERVVREFAGKTFRPAALAGSAYPEDAGELAALLDRVLARPDTPRESGPARPRALAAPHIDLRVAERTYGIAYRAVRHLSPSGVLILGTGHSLGGHRYAVTAKTFTTPLGRVLPDRAAVKRLRAACREALAPDDFAHRSEHSIEFQILFLQRLFPMERIPVLPVLCGNLDDLCGRVRSPLEAPPVRAFVEELAAWLAAPPEGKLVIAGIDLSHVGPKFGDSEPARLFEPAFRTHDQEMLSAAADGDAEKLFAVAARARNRYRVCGFPALWTLLAVLPGARGAVLDYDIFHEEPTRSAVSFAAMAFGR